MDESWSAKYSQKSLQSLKKLPQQAQKQIVSAVRRLAAQDPSCDVKKLKTRQAEWRLRVGSYRVIFERDKERNTIWIIDVALRNKSTYS